MYRRHFGLRDLPFRNTPDEDFFYGSAQRRDIVDALEYVVSRKDAIIKVTGEVGSGKTTLLRILADRLAENGYKVVFIPTPRLSAEETLRFIARDLGLELSGKETKVELYDKLYRYLLEAHESSRGVVVLIDEAHTMPLDTLEEVRLLSNIETAKQKLLTIVLFGQPELDRLLDRKVARQLKSRIMHSFELNPLTDQQVHEYLNFRMTKAGYVGETVFDEKVARLIRKASSGLPRMINNIADKLLHAVYARGGVRVEPVDFRSAGIAFGVRQGLSYLLSSVLGILLIGVGLFLYFFKQEGGEPSHSTTAAGISEVSIKKTDYPADSGGDNESLSNVLAGGMGDRAGTESRQVTPDKDDDYLPWDPDRLIVVLATVPCDGVDAARKLLDQGGIRNFIILQFEKEGAELCTFITGAFSSVMEAGRYIASLSGEVTENRPYAIEVHKFNKMFRERNAKIYEQK